MRDASCTQGYHKSEYHVSNIHKWVIKIIRAIIRVMIRININIHERVIRVIT